MKKRDLKPGDRFTVTACLFQSPDLADESICVIVSPMLFYSECFDDAETAVKEYLNLSVCERAFPSDSEEEISESLAWANRTLNGVRTAVNKALRTGEPPYASVYSEAISVDVKIVADEDGELDWKELKRVKILP